MTRAASDVPCIYVVAGPNGAGKSSILGEMILQAGGDYFNPDLIANQIQAESPGLTREEVNSLAWRSVRDRLQMAIEKQLTFAFETTLGGNTITGLLSSALDAGLQVRIWFTCLASVQMHIERVAERVRRGGHGIPEEKIRERYESSRKNLIRLLPRLTELCMYDNSVKADLRSNVAPQPRLLLHMESGKVLHMLKVSEIPDWAKPIVEMAMKLDAGRRSSLRSPLC